jgi:hypothetical protein
VITVAAPDRDRLDRADLDARLEAALRPPPIATATTFRATGLARWLDRAYGDTPVRDRFTPDLSRLVSVLPQRVSILTDLAARYPARDERRLSSESRAKLHALTSRLYTDLVHDLERLKLHVAALAGSRFRHHAVAQTPADWRRRATLASAPATQLDRLIDDLFASDDLAPDDERARRLDQTFAALWDVVNAR